MIKLTKQQPSWRKIDRGQVQLKMMFLSHCKACQTNILRKQNGIDNKSSIKRAKSMLEQWKACLVSHRLYKSMVVCSFRIVHYRKVSALRTNQTELKFSKRFFHVVAANHSFSSSNEDSEKFKRLIPRLQRDTHSMLINFGILLYTELLLM